MEKENRGGKREGAGRPKGTTGKYKEVKKSLNLSIRISEEQKQKLQIKAEAEGKSISKYLLDLAKV